MKKLMNSAVSRRTFLGGAAAAGALGLAACNGGGDTTTTDDTQGDASATGGNTISAGSAYAPSEYNPTKTSSAFCLGSNWHVLEGLYGTDPHDSPPSRSSPPATRSRSTRPTSPSPSARAPRSPTATP